MTREIIEGAKESIIPFIMGELRHYNVNGNGEVHAEQARKDLEEICCLAIKALEQEPRWIPVEERLPEVYEVVMTTRHGVVYPETRLTEDGWEWLYESGADYWEETDDIEAWMPLPKAYREVEE